MHILHMYICIFVYVYICAIGCKCVYYTRSDADYAGRRWSLKESPIYAFPNGEIGPGYRDSD